MIVTPKQGLEEGGLQQYDLHEEEEYAFGKDSVLAAIEAVREGKCVVVTDDEDRENEGDIIFAAEKVRLAATIERNGRSALCVNVP